MLEKHSGNFGHIESRSHAVAAITTALSGELRSHYFRKKCMAQKYIFPVDILDIEVMFEGNGGGGDIAWVGEYPLNCSSPLIFG